ncbi:hypothetical protein F5X68DRAFT_213536 [Plectosphaerella plurivora]|uniref:Uncharacterized protein n=1 Tax=Plectosphaerella plurivora TaxID=936078 RepID=A0A9P9A5J2_9PEZI|nr:hypothetical protein F5X68DRAFT_213536 [Plectosphaerella plurivora]
MENDAARPSGSASRQGGRSAIPRFSNDSRKSLLQRPSKETLRQDTRPSVGRSAYSEGLSVSATTGYDRRSVSPTPSMTSSNGDGASRIPRPSSAAGGVFSKARQQISLTEAYRMAEAEDAIFSTAPRTVQLSPARVDGSPSPAPRPRPSSRLSDNDKSRRSSLYRGATLMARSDRSLNRQGGNDDDNDTVRSLDSVSSSGSFDRRLGQYADAQHRSHSPSPRLSFQAPSGKASRIPEAGRSLSKRASLGNLNNSPQPQAFSKGHVPKGWVAHLLAQEDLRAKSPVQGREEWEHAPAAPLQSIENQPSPQEPTPPTSRPTSAEAFDNSSPNKSYAWQIDQDFTAGDLQFSDSPRINTAELDRPEPAAPPHPASPGRRERREDRLSDVRHAAHGAGRVSERGDKAKAKGNLDNGLVVSPRKTWQHLSNTKLDEIRQREHDLAQQERTSPEPTEGPKNTKLDEIRDREKAFLSKRALASNRLDDIRERNSMSGSLSPEQPKPQQPRATVDTTPSKTTDPGSVDVGEKIPNTPVTIYRGSQQKDETEAGASLPWVKGPGDHLASQSTSRHTRSDSKELLRLLARATSASPASETGGDKARGDKGGVDKASVAPSSLPEDQDAARAQAPEVEKPRPSVGFSGVPRSPSVDSVKEKRSSRAMSDNDPTDRIEGEMKLFALMDNHSERGSVRAPSVGVPSDDEEDEVDVAAEETPRAPRIDAALLPTPKVLGAFVETPANVKLEDALGQEGDEASNLAPAHSKVPSVTTRPASDRPRSRPRSKLFVSETYDQAEPPADNPPVAFEPVSAPATAGLRRRRTRSLPRSRGPLLNSVKPPSVKDDLLEIQRTYQLDDSTLDDFEKLLTDTKTTSEPLGNVDLLLTKMRIKQEEDLATSNKDNSELERYDRMSKTLNDGLMGIRTAKLGIERLEGNLVHHDNQPSVAASSAAAAPAKPRPTAKEPIIKRSPSFDEKLDVKSRSAQQKHRRSSHEQPLSHHWPRLFRLEPFRLTFLGMLLLLVGSWFVAETTMCSYYCRPVSCTSGSGPCVWEPTDPSWGTALPVKLDQWVSNGQGLQAYHKFVQDASDAYLDIQDYLTGTSIDQVNVDALDFYGKRQHRRRLRKRGLAKAAVPAPGESTRWSAVGSGRVEMGRGQEDTREYMYDMDYEGESFGADEQL